MEDLFIGQRPTFWKGSGTLRLTGAVVKRSFIALVLFLSVFAVKAQAQNATGGEPFDPQAKLRRIIDSIKSVIDKSEHDTLVCNAYLGWGEQVYQSNPDTAVILFQKARETAETSLAKNHSPALEKKYLTDLATALNNIGYIYKHQGDIPKALEYYRKSLNIQGETGNKKGIASSLNNIGRIYDSQGDIPKALEFFHKSLKIKEEIGNKSGIAISLNNIGYVYKRQGDIPKALEFYAKCMAIREELGDKRGIAESLNNIGYIYNNQGDIPKALEFYQKSLKIKEEIGAKSGIAISLNNIGYIYKHQGDIPKALEYYQKSLKIQEETGNKRGIASSLNNLGGIELDKGALPNALSYGIRGLAIARDIGSPELISLSSGLLSKVTKNQGDFEQALEMFELHIRMRDSIKNEENQKVSIRQEAKYEFEKAMLVKEQEEKEALRLEAEVIGRRDNLQYSVILIAILVLFGGVLSLGFINLSERMTEGIIFFSFLILFEFLLVLADPYIEGWSGGAPGIKLLFNAGIAALIFPAHAFFESRLKGRLVESKA